MKHPPEVIAVGQRLDGLPPNRFVETESGRTLVDWIDHFYFLANDSLEWFGKLKRGHRFLMGDVYETVLDSGTLPA